MDTFYMNSYFLSEEYSMGWEFDREVGGSGSGWGS